MRFRQTRHGEITMPKCLLSCPLLLALHRIPATPSSDRNSTTNPTAPVPKRLHAAPIHGRDLQTHLLKPPKTRQTTARRKALRLTRTSNSAPATQACSHRVVRTILVKLCARSSTTRSRQGRQAFITMSPDRPGRLRTTIPWQQPRLRSKTCRTPTTNPPSLVSPARQDLPAPLAVAH